MDREFDELVRRGWGPSTTKAGFVPPVELVTEGDNVRIRVELPGVDVAKDLDLVVERGRLVIRGERRDERREEATGVLVRELRYGSFRREFALPDGVDADGIEASYDQGMLEVLVKGAGRREPESRAIPIRGIEKHQTIEASTESEPPTTE